MYTTAVSGNTLLALDVDHLATAIETVGTDMMTQVGFTGGRFDGQRGRFQRVVGTTHATLEGDFLFAVQPC